MITEEELMKNLRGAGSVLLIDFVGGYIDVYLIFNTTNVCFVQLYMCMPYLI